jgi:uncharacterized membrane protein
MKISSKTKNIIYFLTGALVSIPITVYTVTLQIISENMQVMHIAASNYELSSSLQSKEEILDYLNSAISCAIVGYEMLESSKAKYLISDDYLFIIEKAYDLRKISCDYNLIKK